MGRSGGCEADQGPDNEANLECEADQRECAEKGVVCGREGGRVRQIEEECAEAIKVRQKRGAGRGPVKGRRWVRRIVRRQTLSVSRSNQRPRRGGGGR